MNYGLGVVPSSFQSRVIELSGGLVINMKCLLNDKNKSKIGPDRLSVMALTAYLSLALSTDLRAGESLLAYWTTAQSVQERESALKSEFDKVGLDLTVFAKFKEFNDEIKSKSPSFVIAPAEFEFVNNEYVPIVGFDGPAGKPNFKYQFYTLADGGVPDVANSKLGVVEQADRAEIKEVIGKLSKKIPKSIKTVSKSEDLFPLLVFKSADVIMLSPQDFESLKEKFTTAVKVIGESEMIDYPKIYVKKGQDAKTVTEAIAKLSSDGLKKVGFSSTRALLVGAK